jgi:hypothetical protein
MVRGALPDMLFGPPPRPSGQVAPRVAKGIKGAQARADLEDHVATPAPIAAVRPAARHILLAVEVDHASPTGT